MTTRNITVASVQQRPVKTRYGDKTAYAVFGTDGTKIEFDFKKPDAIGVVVGGSYEVEVEADKYGLKLVKGTLPTSTGIAVAPAVAGGVGTVSVHGEAAFPVPPTDYDNINIRTAALTSAVRFWENRAIESTVTVEQQTEHVIKTAYLFADFISGQREIKALGGLSSEADSSGE